MFIFISGLIIHLDKVNHIKVQQLNGDAVIEVKYENGTIDNLYYDTVEDAYTALNDIYDMIKSTVN